MRQAIAGLLSIMLLASCANPMLIQGLKGTDGNASGSESSIAYSGKVIGLDGLPAAGVLVRGHLISNNSAGLIGIYGSKYRVQTAALETRSDQEGRFTLREYSAQPLNIEAILSEEVKAIQLNVASSTSDLELKLDYTGAIAGRVTAPAAPTVTNFEGVDVFIPGTSYLAKTDSAGRFLLSNVAAGSFSLVATKVGLGRANVHGVKAVPKQTSTAPDLELSVAAPTITGIEPSGGGRGSTVVIKGEKFGASSGETFQVAFGGATAAAPKRLDDKTIQVVVPSGATSGDVVVSVGGIPSNQGVFTVLDQLVIGPNIRFLGEGRSQRYTAWAQDSAGRTLMTPLVEWSTTGSVAASGSLVTGTAIGTGVLTAKSGFLSASLGLDVVEAGKGVVNTLAGRKDMGSRDDWGPNATFNYPHGVTIGPDGNLYVADRSNHRIRMVTPEGRVSTFAGTGDPGRDNGPRLQATFWSPVDLVFDKDGNLYVTEEHGIRKISKDGTVSRLAGHFAGFNGFVDNPVGTQAEFNLPHGIAYGPDDHLYVADYRNHAIRKVSLSGAVTTLAGSGAAGFADAAGRNAQFNWPVDVAVDAQGNVFVADNLNHRIRKLTPEGLVSTYAGSATFGFKEGVGTDAVFRDPHGIAIDEQGNLFVTDKENHEIRRIDPSRNVTSVAGNGWHLASSQPNMGFRDGAADWISFDEPFGICVDGEGRIYVGDRGNNRIRVITP